MNRINVKPTSAANLKQYLENLITEKGKDLDQVINTPETSFLIGFTYHDLIAQICAGPLDFRTRVHSDLVTINCKNGDVFDCLHFLAALVAKHFKALAA